jgi:Ca-activated chloride channel family protein
MHWAYPQFVWLSVLAAGIAVLVDVGRVRRQRAMRLLAMKTTLLVSRRARSLKTALLAAAAALLAVAAVGPQWGWAEAETRAATGRDVLFVLDVSRSMLAEDVQPSRLERARAEIRDLAASLASKGGYRVGLIAFADRASVLCPLTFDHSAFDEELRNISLQRLRMRGDAAGEHGTQIGTALRRAARMLDKDQAEFTDVFLFSDGDDMEQETLGAADDLAKLGVRVHPVGLGDPNVGSLIPLKGSGSHEGYLKYRGEPVRTRLEENVLREIARRTSGEYVPLRTGQTDLGTIFSTILAHRPARALDAAGTSRVWVHRYQWFLLPAVLLLLAEMMVGEGPKSRGQAVVEKVNYFQWARRKRPVTAESMTS